MQKIGLVWYKSFQRAHVTQHKNWIKRNIHHLPFVYSRWKHKVLNALNLYQTKQTGMIYFLLCLTVLTKTKLWQEKHILWTNDTKLYLHYLIVENCSINMSIDFLIVLFFSKFKPLLSKFSRIEFKKRQNNRTLLSSLLYWWIGQPWSWHCVVLMQIQVGIFTWSVWLQMWSKFWQGFTINYVLCHPCTIIQNTKSNCPSHPHRWKSGTCESWTFEWCQTKKQWGGEAKPSSLRV